jgi:hypothetical protein
LLSLVLLIVTSCLVAPPLTIAAGPDPEIDADSFNPAIQLYEFGEANRLEAISRQLELNNRMMWSSYYVPGDLWGPPAGWPVRQPIGHETQQTAPNRWMYRPLYDGEELPAPSSSQPLPAPRATPGANNLPAPATGSGASRPAPSDAAPGDYLPPQASVRGPREF